MHPKHGLSDTPCALVDLRFAPNGGTTQFVINENSKNDQLPYPFHTDAFCHTYDPRCGCPDGACSQGRTLRLLPKIYVATLRGADTHRQGLPPQEEQARLGTALLHHRGRTLHAQHECRGEEGGGGGTEHELLHLQLHLPQLSQGLREPAPRPHHLERTGRDKCRTLLQPRFHVPACGRTGTTVETLQQGSGLLPKGCAPGPGEEGHDHRRHGFHQHDDARRRGGRVCQHEEGVGPVSQGTHEAQHGALQV